VCPFIRTTTKRFCRRAIASSSAAGAAGGLGGLAIARRPRPLIAATHPATPPRKPSLGALRPRFTASAENFRFAGAIRGDRSLGCGFTRRARGATLRPFLPRQPQSSGSAFAGTWAPGGWGRLCRRLSGPTTGDRFLRPEEAAQRASSCFSSTIGGDAAARSAASLPLHRFCRDLRLSTYGFRRVRP